MTEKNTPYRKFGKNFDTGLSVQENWGAAELLSDGWWLYCSHEARERYRNCGGNFDKMAFEDSMIKLDVIELLYDGEIIAMGIPEGTADAEIIPANAFRPRADNVDWGVNRVIGLGRIYESVAICRAAQVEPQTKPKIIRVDTNHVLSRGRPSLYDKSAKVIAELFEIESNKVLSAENLHPNFAKRFSELFPRSYMVAPPAVRTLRNHLKRYWQELAENGNN